MGVTSRPNPAAGLSMYTCALSGDGGVTDWSVGVWIRSYESGGYQAERILDDSYTNPGFLIMHDDNGGSGGNAHAIHAYFCSTSINSGSWTMPQDGTWHHILFTRKSSTGAITLYADGTQVGSGTAATGAKTLQNLGVMANNTTSVFSENFWGGVAEIGMWTAELTAGNATTLASSPPDSIPSGLYHYWKCLNHVAIGAYEEDLAGSLDLLAETYSGDPGVFATLDHPFSSGPALPVFMNQYRQRRA